MRVPTPAVALLLAAAACAPAVSAPAPAAAPTPDGLPPIPAVRGPLAIRVVHPTPGTPRPNVDSSFVFGSVGTGGATLTINGAPVRVEPNGAFIAYVAVPRDGRLALVASAEGRADSAVVSYRLPSPAPTPAPPAPRVETVPFAQPVAAAVVGVADTLRTGSDAATGRATLTGNPRWFLPAGARVWAVARRGDLLQVRLDSATLAWFPAANLALADSIPPPAAPAPPAAAAPAATPSTPTRPVPLDPPLTPLGPLASASAARWVDVRLPAGRAPFLVQADSTGASITLYGVSLPAGAPASIADPFVRSAEWSTPAPGTARLALRLAQPLWGYKAWYDADGALVVRLRRPPPVDSAAPLRGVRIVVDPGHPPAGATGPTGLWEPEANLAIALPLVRELRRRGADVRLTRTADQPVGLTDRPALAAALDADLLVSVHNNAFGEGANPFRRNGTSTYYFHPFSAALARTLNRELVAATQARDLGALTGNLALVRPTWMPTALTESLFMSMPQHEAALRDARFVERLAQAHAVGIEAFFRSLRGP